MPSYSPVFSQAFIQYTSETPNTRFDVPTGFTAIVRQISCYQDIGAYLLETYIADSDAAPGLTISELEQSGGLNYVQQEGRWVVPGGGYIAISLSPLGTSPQVYVGGYLLRNTLS